MRKSILAFLHRLRSHITFRARMLSNLPWRGLALWATLLFAACFIPWLATQSVESSITWSGIALQILGLMTVVIGLNRSRKLFNKPSLGSSASQWVSSFLKGPKTHYVSMKAIEIGSPRASGYGFVTPGGEQTLEARIQAIEQRQRTFAAQYNKQIEALKKEINDTRQREHEARMKAEADMRTLLETSAIGGINLELSGLVYIFLGIIMSSAPNDLAAWLHL